MTELEVLKSKVTEYEKRMGIGEDDPAKDGYLVLVGILRQQTSYLKDFKIIEEIKKTAKEDATYGRAKDMWENLPKMIQSVSTLRMELKMDGEEKKNITGPISPQSIASLNGK